MMPDRPSQRDGRVAQTRSMRRALLVGLVVLVAIQLVPMTRETGPAPSTPVEAPPDVKALPSPRACANCHSGRDGVAVVQPRRAGFTGSSTNDVHEGPRATRLRDAAGGEAQAEGEALRRRSPRRSGRVGCRSRYYRLVHAEARLTDASGRPIVDWANDAEDAALSTAQ
jgi:hypothetical protein